MGNARPLPHAALLFLLIHFSLYHAFPAHPSHSLSLTHRLSTTCPIKLPIQQDQQRVIGGSIPTDYLRSHIVSFSIEGCGGTLISARWVLTAAHCAISTSSTAYIAGTNSSNGLPIPVSAVHNHPNFDFPKNDIALVQLASPALSSSHWVTINSNIAIPALAEFSRVAGYGFTTEKFNPSHRAILHQVDVPIVDTSTCRAAFKRVKSYLAPNIQNSVHLCAGYNDGGCDACNADSGGPLLVYSEHLTLIQIGIVSFGYGCGQPHMPGGYTRVSPYVEWMRSVGAQFSTMTKRHAVFLSGSGPPAQKPSASPTASKVSVRTTAATPSASSPQIGTPASVSSQPTPQPSVTPASPVASQIPPTPPVPTVEVGPDDEDGAPMPSGEASGGVDGTGTGIGDSDGMDVDGSEETSKPRSRISGVALGTGLGAGGLVLVMAVVVVVFRRRSGSTRRAESESEARSSAV